MVVAERAGLVVGVVGYVGSHRPRETIFPPDWAIVRMLSVLPAERGRGIRRLLTAACIERARRDRVATVGLHTTPVMRVAPDLYLRMGFVLQRAIPDRFGVPYAVYALTLSLNRTLRSRKVRRLPLGPWPTTADQMAVRTPRGALR